MKPTGSTVPKAFLDVFRQVVRRVQPTKAIEPETAADYFEVLKEFHIDVLREAAKQIAMTTKFFPTVSEWYQAAKTWHLEHAPRAVDRRVMMAEETGKHRRAVGLGYEDAPCACWECSAAAVTHLPLRFVPEFTSDDRDERARYADRDKEVTTGHWAHGEELGRWYRAKHAFYATARALGHHRVLPLILRDREPGEEG